MAEPAGRPWGLTARYLICAAVFGAVAAWWWPRCDVLGPLFAWVALDQLLLAVIFLLEKPQWLGKRRRDGRFSPWPSIVFLPYLLWIWVYFHAKRLLLVREPCWNVVVPGVYLGRRPLPREVPEEVTHVVDLTCELSEPAGVVAGRRYTCLPMLNRWIPDLRDLEGLVADLMAEGEVLYVHCGAGKGRSALVVAVLLRARGIAESAEAAEALAAEARPIVGLHGCQRRQLASLDLNRLRAAGS